MTARLPKFHPGDIVRNMHGEGGRVISVEPHPISGRTEYMVLGEAADAIERGDWRKL